MDKWDKITIFLSIILLCFLIGYMIRYREDIFLHFDLASHKSRIDFMTRERWDWIPEWYNGFAQFNFYPPLAFLTGAMLVRMGINSLDSLVFIFVILIVSLFGAVYTFLKNKNKNLGIVGGLFAVLGPFSYSSFYNIGRFGELFSAVFFMLALNEFLKPKKDNKLFVFFAVCMILSHLSTAIIFYIFALFLIVKNNQWGSIKNLALPLTIGSFFLLPFIEFKNYTCLSESCNEHFLISLIPFHIGLFRRIHAGIFLLLIVYIYLWFKNKKSRGIISLVGILNIISVTSLNIVHIYSNTVGFISSVLIAYFINDKKDEKIYKLVFFACVVVLLLDAVGVTKGVMKQLFPNKAVTIIHSKEFKIINSSLPYDGRYWIDFIDYGWYSVLLPRHSIGGWFGQGADKNNYYIDLELYNLTEKSKCEKINNYTKRLGLKYMVLLNKNRQNGFLKCKWPVILNKSGVVIFKSPFNESDYIVEGAGKLRFDEVKDWMNIRFNAEKDGKCLIKVSYFPKWQAYNNGKEIKIENAYPGMLISVKKGEVVLKYGKKTLLEKIGEIISIIGIVIWILTH